MTEPNWNELLDRSREVEDKSFLAEYVEQLCRPESLGDDVKLRVLANSLFGSRENCAKVMAHPDFVTSLILPSRTPLLTLYNLCVDNPEAAEFVAAQEDKLVAALAEERETAVNVLGVLAQELEGLPVSLGRKLLLEKQFIEIFLLDYKFSTDEVLLQSLTDIIAAAESYPDPEVAINAITAITCDDSFTLETARSLPPRQSVVFAVLLGNLTMKMDDMAAVLAHWPTAVDDVVGLFSDDFDTNSEMGVFSAGFFLRNVARDPEIARQLWQKDIHRALAYLEEVEDDRLLYVQLAGLLAAVKFDEKLVGTLLEAESEPELAPELLIARSRAADGLCADLAVAAAHKDTAKELASLIIDGLEQTPSSLLATQPLWVKGTKALAQLSQVVPLDVQSVVADAPDDEAVLANLAAVERAN